MAFKCGPATWASTLPFSTEKDDGTIFVEIVHGNGNMEGRHRRPGGSDEQIKNGKCKAGQEKMEFDREGFHYDGEIFVFAGDIRVVVGIRSSTKAKNKRDGEEVVDDEVWVGVKTGT